MIKGLDYFALSVSDVDQSIAFYRDTLSMELLRVIEARCVS
jgi:catechol 2,3-dioxygenase-like lactoylglutathione lyase family enzyme